MKDLRDRLPFGLVFEEHEPEVLATSGAPIRAGSLAIDAEGRVVEVVSVDGAKAAVLASKTAGSGKPEELSCDDLTAAVRLNEPVFASLDRLGSVEGPGCEPGSPRHIAIEAENYLALGLLVDLYEGQVDCIYIDPPYNTGATDWKYNDRFVDSSDGYRHSKWLSMMQRRLKLAEKLLRPDGVLIVMIDENEVHHLAVLLNQMFPTAIHQMVTIVTNSNSDRTDLFGRVEEHAMFVFNAQQEYLPRTNKSVDDMLSCPTDQGNRPPQAKPVRWNPTKKSGNKSRASDRPNCCYPVGLDTDGNIVGTGRTLSERSAAAKVAPDKVSLDGYQPNMQHDVRAIPGAVDIVWPKAGPLMGRWALAPETFMRYASNRRVRRSGSFFEHLSDNQMALIDAGVLTVSETDPGVGPIELDPAQKPGEVRKVWHRTRHRVEVGGSKILSGLLGEKRFDFPKSLYSTLDAIQTVTADRPDALVVDFFAGSGTTLHAVAALNAADGGSRRCVIVSNNEVSADEAKRLKRRGKSPGDAEWDDLGIFRHVLMPRVKAAVTGHRADGSSVPGKYLPPLYNQPLSVGLPAAVEFFKLVCGDPQQLASSDAFDYIHPLLWAQSGGHGPCPTEGVGGYDAVRIHEPGWLLPGDGTIPAQYRYGVLLRPSRLSGFINAFTNHRDIGHVWTAAADRDEFTYVKQELSQLKPSLVVGWLFEDRYRRFSRAES